MSGFCFTPFFTLRNRILFYAVFHLYSQNRLLFYSVFHLKKQALVSCRFSPAHKTGFGFMFCKHYYLCIFVNCVKQFTSTLLYGFYCPCIFFFPRIKGVLALPFFPLFFFVRDGIYNSAADYNLRWRVPTVCLCVQGQTLLLDNLGML